MEENDKIYGKYGFYCLFNVDGFQDYPRFYDLSCRMGSNNTDFMAGSERSVRGLTNIEQLLT